jgi:hypothetical protein
MLSGVIALSSVSLSVRVSERAALGKHLLRGKQDKAAMLQDTEGRCETRDTVATVHPLHGERVWRRVGVREHVTQDGRQTELVFWECGCVVCGAPFETRAYPGEPSDSKPFRKTTCRLHHLTEGERKLLNAAKDKWRAFESIKRERLRGESGDCDNEPDWLRWRRSREEMAR